ncbi:MAG TPA: hypothetical protein VND98_01735 [Solirubrobacterales bacterium]|nr:hypothetical protein [Solirubrobacterales bacterium]
MGTSLFLVVGPVSIGSLLGTNTATSSAAGLYEEQATTLERKLRKSPQDASLLLSLTRARISAGNALSEINAKTGQPTATPAARVQLEKSSEAWSRYLKLAGKEPNASTAQLAAGALFRLAESSTSGAEAAANLKSAARAQQIVAETQPTLGSVSTLAEFRYFAFDFAGAKKAAAQARSLANSKAQRTQLETALKQVSTRAKAFQKQVKAEAKESKGKGKETLKNPLGGLSGEGSTLR